ncbi:MAG: hypothetical protein IIW01_06235, partial [Thermoguttaceae bacterium]|nr:hypothetical protein [Thermoguttaceae bacterium]
MNGVFNALKRRVLEAAVGGVAQRVATVVFLTLGTTFFISCRQNDEPTQTSESSTVASVENAVDEEKTRRTFNVAFVGWSDVDFERW